ncbi:MAG: hypothetical protein IAE91_12100 [Ignavibacteriaceae bacterium]|nr:hypothetical protein [Ignavibacteriaceae bacterium]
MEVVKDLINFIRERKRYIFIPLLIVLLLLGILIVLGGGTAIAPFIYTIF